MNKTNIKTFLALSILALIFISILSFFYVRNNETLLDSETKSNITEISQQASSAIDNKLSANKIILETLTTDFVKYPNVSFDEKMQRLSVEMEKNNILSLGYADINGDSISVNGTRVNISDRQYFLSAMKGNYAVSKPLISRADNRTEGIVQAVPIKNENKIVGVLFGVYELSKIETLLHTDFFNNSGKSYFIDKYGNIIINSNNDNLSDNIFEFVNSKNEPDIQKIKADLDLDRSGAVRINDKDGEGFYVGYTPINSIKDWYLLTVFPAKIVFNKASEIIVQTTVGVIAIILIFIFLTIILIRNKVKKDRIIEKLAFSDNLTQISNYNKFCIDYKSVITSKKGVKYAFIYFDIDNFKMINETFSYAVGDDILKNTANVLRDVLPKESIYARISNDHFVAMIEYDGIKEHIFDIMEKLTNRLNLYVAQKQINVDIVLSVGIYVIKNADVDVNRAFNKANMARGTIKGLHNERCVFYNEKIKEQIAQKTWIENDVKLAVVNDQFEIYYQPKHSLKDEKMIGMEALVRWNHPTQGFINPGIFIPIIEKSGLVVDVGHWVFENVCKDISAWTQAGNKLVPISVNFSRVELYQTNFINFIKATLSKYDVPSSLIEIELTESSALNDVGFMIKMINELKEIGLSVSMDDFGTGYSSLSFLRELPFDVLKLDRTFILSLETDSKSRNIITSIIYLAKSLGLTVVAEGVETKEQCEFLKFADCDIVQGFYYAKPMPENEIVKYMNK